MSPRNDVPRAAHRLREYHILAVRIALHIGRSDTCPGRIMLYDLRSNVWPGGGARPLKGPPGKETVQIITI